MERVNTLRCRDFIDNFICLHPLYNISVSLSHVLVNDILITGAHMYYLVVSV